MLDGDEPEVCAVREALEETGIAIDGARRVFDAYHEPRRHDGEDRLFRRALSRAATAIGAGGGVDEDEHIEVIEVPFADALAMIASGAIADAKTIALLYYAKSVGIMERDVRRPRLPDGK